MAVLEPDLQEFLRRCEGASLVPVSSERLGDLETPISLYKKLRGSGPTFLLESAEGGETVGRYSFIGLDPRLTFQAWGNRVLWHDGSGRLLREETGDPWELLRAEMERYEVGPTPELPRFFGGAVGYLGYDMVRFIEHLPDEPDDDQELPDAWFLFSDVVVIIDHLQNTLRLVKNVQLPEGASRQEKAQAYGAARADIDALLARIDQGLPAEAVGTAAPAGKPQRNWNQDAFEAAVEKARDYITAGDIFQVVLSQRLAQPVQAGGLDLYRTLRSVNPSPYLFYLEFDAFQLIGSSPELLVRLEGDRVETRPLAGTRPRGETAQEDTALAEELLADEKERAEHLMLVDLGRNDLGRVCTPGTVEVSELFAIERYSHVMHIVSHVEGQLRPDADAFDALRACFPAGTLSGAPKVRAMEIIDELEPTKRGPYGGAVGYFGYSGNMDTCITIRTMLLKKGWAYVQAGAGIVADSQPQREFEETENKARALLRAVARAGAGIGR